MQLERILRNTLIGGIFLVPFIALFVADSMFFPFITGKNFAFRILVELMLGAWILLALLNTMYRPRFSWILVSITVFVGIIAVADIFGEDLRNSFWSNFERMEGLITLLHLLAYIAIVSSVLNTEKLWRYFWNTSVGVSVIMGLYGILQLSGAITIRQGGDRLDGTLGNATYLAGYMLFHIFITAVLLVKWRGANWLRYFYGAIIALQLFILYFTATRGTILGLLGGILLGTFLIAIFERENKWFRRSALGMLIAVSIFIGGFVLVKDTAFVQDSFVLNRFAVLSFEEAKGQARFYIWPMALEGVKEHPILGWGQENFNLVFNKYYRPELHSQEAWFDRVHNVVLDWLVAGGVLGLLAYLSILLFALYYLWRRDSRVYFSVAERSLWTALLAAYFFHNLFVFDNIISYILFFSVLAYIHTMVSKPLPSEHVLMQSVNSGMVSRLATPLVIVAVVFSVYALNWKGIATSQTLIQALTPQENLTTSLEFFRSAAAYNSLGSQEVAEQIAQFSVGIARADIDLSMKQAFLDLGVEELLEELERAPDDARIAIFLGGHLSRFGQFNEGLQMTERAHELSPNKQSILFELGVNRLNSDDLAGALEFFKEAYELYPSFDRARIFYASTAIYNGEFVLAEQLLVEQFGTLAVPDPQLINAYISINRHDLARDAWITRIRDYPDDQQARLSLTAAYLALGEQNLAIKTIEEAILINPDFREQGEAFIQEIRASGIPETEEENVDSP